MNIVKDLFFLKQPCQKVEIYEEAEEIAAQLFKVLSEHKSGVGLAANQIGINKQVCVVNVIKPLWFMNPRYESVTQEVVNFNEACLSFPTQIIRTERYAKIAVTADNFDTIQYFNSQSAESMLECVCIQHEISHLGGKTMFDFEVKCKYE